MSPLVLWVSSDAVYDVRSCAFYFLSDQETDGWVAKWQLQDATFTAKYGE
jgi:hypothetical protein